MMVIEVSDPDEDESPYITIGPSQVANLIQFLMQMQRTELTPRTEDERNHIVNTLHGLVHF